MDGHVEYIDSREILPNGTGQWSSNPWNARRTSN